MPYSVRVHAALSVVMAATVSSWTRSLANAFIVSSAAIQYAIHRANEQTLTCAGCTTETSPFRVRNRADGQLYLRRRNEYAEGFHRCFISRPKTKSSLSLMRGPAGTLGLGCQRPCGGFNRVMPMSRKQRYMSGQEEAITISPEDDAERAGINSLITHFSETPMNKWQPTLLEEQLSNLMNGGLYKQTMAARLAKAENEDERNGLRQVDAFLSGYIKQERNKLSRKKISRILGAAVKGGEELDTILAKMSSANHLDAAMKEFLADAIETEVNKGKTVHTSDLLKVLKVVKARVEAEEAIRQSPDIRKLAKLMEIDSVESRKYFLQKEFTRLEDLDKFVRRVDACMEYIGSESHFSIRTNMPLAKLDQLRAIHKEATEFRRKYIP